MPRYIREIVLVAVLFGIYQLGRFLMRGDAQIAVINAYDVWHVERWLSLPDELGFQQAFLNWPSVIKAANVYYATVHFPATALCLIWLYRRNHEFYVSVRNVMVVLTMGALAMHVLLPLAPPRMLVSLGFVDTAEMYGTSVYHSSTATGIANEFAAMPSLHVGWALVVAYGIVVQLRTAWRWLGLLHPIITVWVVVVSANHFWIDAIASAMLLSVALVVVRPGASRAVAGSLSKAEALAG